MELVAICVLSNPEYPFGGHGAAVRALTSAVTHGQALRRGDWPLSVIVGYRRGRGRMPSATATSCAVLSGTCLWP